MNACPRVKSIKLLAWWFGLSQVCCEAKTTIIEKCQYLTINRGLHTQED